MSPLQGVKVVELTANLAGPFCGAILAGLGAEVIKVERPDKGDDVRGWGPPFADGVGTTFVVLNANKAGITVDLADARDAEWLKAFIGEADVFVHNMRPGSLEKLGLGEGDLTTRFPGLIYAAISGYGAIGPLRLKPGYDSIVQAFAGLYSVNGAPESPPARIGPSVLDLGTGVWTALAILAAVIERSKTGRGCVVTTSLLETAFSFLGPLLATHSLTGRQPMRERAGTEKVAIYDCFKTSDGEVLIGAANDRLFVKAATALGHPEWAVDPRFSTNAARVGNKADLTLLCSELLATQPTQHWLDRLEGAGVPCAPINDLQGAIEHPQSQALGIFDRSPSSGVNVTRLPFSFDGRRPEILRQAPQLGADNDRIKPAQ